MVEMFKEVSGTVWISFEAVVIENTIKEECINKKYSNDNYSYIAPVSL